MIRFLLVFSVCVSVTLGAGFYDSLTEVQRKELGLDGYSPAQIAALNKAVEAYDVRGREKAVEETKKKTMEEFKNQTLKLQPERVVSRIKGKFFGWSGGTLFELENGQVWKQVGSSSYILNGEENTEVEISKARSGHFRLHLEGGYWVTVVRIK